MTDIDKNETLFEAVSKGDFIAAKEAIKNGADVNYIPDSDPEFNNTTLMEASSRTNLLIARLLVESGADVNKKNERNRTPLMYAVGDDSSSLLIKYFIEKDADVNIRDKVGDTALSWAVSSDNIDAVLMLLSVPGIDIDVRDYGGRSHLDHSRSKTISFLLEEAEEGRFPSADEFDLKIPSNSKPSFADRVGQKENISR